MSKALLILDMPESCDMCDLTDMVNGKMYCGVPGCGELAEDYISCRPDWCPLRPMPEKKIECAFKSCSKGCCTVGWNGNRTNCFEICGIPIDIMEEWEKYRVIGTVEECQAAAEKQKAKKPIYKHYEDKGEPPYIKIACPNGCRIQLYPVTEKHLAHEHIFCPKCGQRLDWSDEE